jgi:DNA polymerase-3 subunit beta
MKTQFSLTQETLFPILVSLQSMCTKKTAVAHTENILFEVTPRELIIKSTDLEISAQWTLIIETDNDDTNMFLVSGKRIHDVIKELDGLIHFSLDTQNLYITTENGVSFVLAIKDTSDFPPFPERIENLMQLESADIIDCVSKVAFLIPSNNSNPALNGMLLECDEKGLSMIATDGHCLARVITEKYKLASKKTWLLPKRAVLELKKILEVSVQNIAHTVAPDTLFLGTCSGNLVFSGPGFNFFTRLIADPFPQYAPILQNEGFFVATVAKDGFLRSMKRAGCLLAGNFVATDFYFNHAEKSLRIKLENKEVGTLEESLPLQEFNGETLATRFYTPYVLNGLQVISEKQVTCKIKGNRKPLIFESKNDRFAFMYLVMPVSSQAQ